MNPATFVKRENNRRVDTEDWDSILLLADSVLAVDVLFALFFLMDLDEKKELSFLLKEK